MAARDDHGLCPEPVHRTGERLLVELLLRSDRLPAVARLGCQLAGLIDVRRDHGRPRHEPVHERLYRKRVEQHGAALRDHDRIEHHRRIAHVVERLRDRRDGLLVAKHSDLHGVDPDVAGDRSHLSQDGLPAEREDSVDAHRALRRDRGDRRHPVDAGPGERLQVGLDARAAAGVRSGDRQRGWGPVRGA